MSLFADLKTLDSDSLERDSGTGDSSKRSHNGVGVAGQTTEDEDNRPLLVGDRRRMLDDEEGDDGYLAEIVGAGESRQVPLNLY